MRTQGGYTYMEHEAPLSDLREQYPPLQRCVGYSSIMRSVMHDLVSVATTNYAVLLAGESGTGKELIARIIHDIAKNDNAPFEAINCGAIPETLLESELFGHVAGAFTGASRNHRGIFERAQDGTVFLDEIAEMSPSAQVKLLRVLQEGTYLPVGGEDLKRSRARVVAATNRDLLEEVSKGRFREDLYYRLNVYPIRLPALRERREDIAPLIDFFLTNHAAELKRPAPRMASNALRRLMVYSYPGNVRELQNMVSALLIEARGRGEIVDRDVVAVFSRHRLNEAGEQRDGTGVETAPEEVQAVVHEQNVGAWVIEQLRMYHFNIALAERMLLARKRSADDPRSVPVCSRSGLTYYLQGEAFRVLADQNWNLDSAAVLLAGDNQLVPRVEGKLQRFMKTALSTVAKGSTPGQRLIALRKAFVKLPHPYHDDLVRLADEWEKGRWS